MISKKIGFIGAGKMAEALIKALIEKKIVRAVNIIASDISSARLAKIKKQTGINTAKNNKEVVKKSDVVFLAVKPQNMNSVLDEIKKIVRKEQMIVSIAAGIKLKTIEKKLNAKIVRVMPNTPCLVGEMAAGFSVGKKVTNSEKIIVDEILNSAGKAFLLTEKQLDAVTALSGSGPAFFAYFTDAMAKAAIKQGLNKDAAYELAFQTCKGTGKLLQETGLAPEELIKMVASPKGTTEAGLKVLNNSQIKKILQKTINAAVKRSKELGK